MRVIRRYRQQHDHCQDSAERFSSLAADIAAEPPVPFAPLAAESPAAAAVTATADEGEGAGGEGAGAGASGEDAEAEAGPVASGVDDQDEAVSRVLVFIVFVCVCFLCASSSGQSYWVYAFEGTSHDSTFGGVPHRGFASFVVGRKAAELGSRCRPIY